MVKQGDIIKINFNPQSGHEQAGYRPAVVVSNNFFNNITKLAIVCPITNSPKEFPLHIRLDERTQTTGSIMCQHIRTLDVESRGYNFIEKLPDDILQSVINVVFAEIEVE
ncbi:type II toxin-antitoxin system PemK/MazF family toxin [Ruminococcus sp.]|uniref:type II toxin-antitoxin system PemK/MazF family toxin n=1 Tax=Ruminococcus sp. TaxID=41978 RepID=UPI0025FFC7ED|nr:type II toxin-antitoxin system PemK/MazF family toxin [Ruminococcus sp.]MBQ6252465.1 type II toxin-antitoxin system PemK/MazF family toxin [Ruminococcus sp.]